MTRLLALLLVGPAALAQPALEVETPAAIDVSVIEADRGRSSTTTITPTQAVLLSVGATAGSIALGASVTSIPDVAEVLIIGGIVFGPSAGNFFQGELLDVAIGTGTRALGIGLMIGSSIVLFDGPGTSALGETALLATAGVGAVAVLVGAGYDLVTTHKNAGRVRVRPHGAGLALQVGL